MRAIVHIGAPKTGSSTIQQFLFVNAARLAEQGFRFHRNVPNRGSQYEYPLAALARIDRLLPGREEQTRYSSTDLATHKATGAKVEADLAANRYRWTEPVAIVSSEHILPWLRAPEEVRSLDAIFRTHFDDVRYLVYLRNQEDLIVSEYSETLKRGSNQGLQALIDARTIMLDHNRRVRVWEEAVGRDRIHVRLLDSGFLKDGDLMEDFAAFCGFSLEGLQMPPRVNESLSAPAAECLRIINDRVPQLLEDGRPNPLRKGVVDQLMNLSEGGPKLALSQAQREQVQAAVGESNEALRRDYFPDRETLFSPPSERPLPPRELLLEQAIDMASRLIIRLRLGRMAGLTEDERQIARQRAPGGISNGIAEPRKADKHRQGAESH